MFKEEKFVKDITQRDFYKMVDEEKQIKDFEQNRFESFLKNWTL